MTSRAKFLPLLLLVVLSLLLLSAAPASAGYPIAKDGKIYACFKTKGRGKGTVRIIRNAKVRCPRKWRKMAWHATARSGPQGAAGATGSTGATGEKGAPGGAGNVSVEALEGKVTELLARVEGLESAVGSLCGQVEALTGQSGELVDSMEALNTTLTTLVALFTPISLPSALPSYNCPTS